MDSRINYSGYNQSFCGLFGESKFKGIKLNGTGADVQHEITHYSFSDEPDEAIQKAVARKSRDYATCTNGNGFGTQVHHTNVINGGALPITRKDYKNYKLFRGGSELAEKVEKVLSENGLENHLNSKWLTKLVRVFSKK